MLIIHQTCLNRRTLDRSSIIELEIPKVNPEALWWAVVAGTDKLPKVLGSVYTFNELFTQLSFQDGDLIIAPESLRGKIANNLSVFGFEPQANYTNCDSYAFVDKSLTTINTILRAKKEDLIQLLHRLRHLVKLKNYPGTTRNPILEYRYWEWEITPDLNSLVRLRSGLAANYLEILDFQYSLQFIAQFMQFLGFYYKSNWSQLFQYEITMLDVYVLDAYVEGGTEWYYLCDIDLQEQTHKAVKQDWLNVLKRLKWRLTPDEALLEKEGIGLLVRGDVYRAEIFRLL